MAEYISTHAPLAGRDEKLDQWYTAWDGFQPTRPLRGATLTGKPFRELFGISTHAPLAGRDTM